MTDAKIPFNRPHMTGRELGYITEAHRLGQLAGDGPFTRRCQEWLQRSTGCVSALLTHSCTAALEMAALLLRLEPGDEIILPSFTFVSTANAFVLQGAVPVFVDVRADTLNLDERLLEAAITPRTRAIVPVHYAGVGCAMDEIVALASDHGVRVIEDAAHGLLATYKGRPLGSLGSLAATSFHETKNVMSGEGGCLLVRDAGLLARAEIVRNKGTDRAAFSRGEVDRYTWQDVGSSYLPGEMVAAFLWAQLEDAEAITRERVRIWSRYHELLEPLERTGLLRRMVVPDDCRHNGHMYYVLVPEGVDRRSVLAALEREGIGAVFHYVPLHSSPGGRRYGRAHGELAVTDSSARRLIRLPMWLGLTPDQQDRVVEGLQRSLEARG